MNEKTILAFLVVLGALLLGYWLISMAWTRLLGGRKPDSASAPEAGKTAGRNQADDFDARARKKPAAAEIRDAAYYARILGLTGRVTQSDVRARYLQLVSQYHPDKVNHLGEKLKAVAEEEMKKINEAYNYFRENWGS